MDAPQPDAGARSAAGAPNPAAPAALPRDPEAVDLPGSDAAPADRVAAFPAEPGPTGTGTAAPDLPRVIPPPGTPDSGAEIVLLPDGSPVSPVAPELPRVFRPDGQSAPQLSGAPVPGFTDASGVRVNRLPSITPADPTAPAASGEGGAITAPDSAATEAPPLRRFASAFAAPTETALLSVVIYDAGTAAGGLDPVTLKTLGLPVTIALDPGQADAATRAAEYRAAGLEVAILAQPLPAGATPADLEVALEAWHRALPEAVALVEPAQPLIQNNRALAQHLTKALAREGLGLITQDQGLNAAAQIAGAEGLPGAEVWRVLDTGREDAPVVERMLGRAGFEASRDGRLVVMLTSWPQSVAGLVAWAAGAPRGVTLAPVTAQMQDGAF
ncbi:MAG: divergent polysaccharide deacetylase family protein [Sphingomonadales bacterium]|nr:divergent polysaccharide deacetylase family protein [Sphingomonadales bacterium]